MRFLSFSSGSCGNCYLLLRDEPGTAPSGILIDAGVSIRRMKRILESLSLDFDCFQAVLVTHDHGDHIRNLGSICKRRCIPRRSCRMHLRAIPLPGWKSEDAGGIW